MIPLVVSIFKQQFVPDEESGRVKFIKNKINSFNSQIYYIELIVKYITYKNEITTMTNVIAMRRKASE